VGNRLLLALAMPRPAQEERLRAGAPQTLSILNLNVRRPVRHFQLIIASVPFHILCVTLRSMYESGVDSVLALRHAREVDTGKRFRFGENWSRFLGVLNDDRIRQAEASLCEVLGCSMSGKSFADVGSGSGLFSLAARRLGARVHSFDYDRQSVACTLELKRRYFAEDPLWTVEQGSVLDVEYLSSLGNFEVVYSWGVLHHTGSMWQALENVAQLVRDGGTLFVAIYNDQGKLSRHWRKIKRFCNNSPKPVQLVLVAAVCLKTWWRRWLKRIFFAYGPLNPGETPGTHEACPHGGISPTGSVVTRSR
jgi:2-polyprenyl-3-methyl-5-hydroxy-6-metoxy-1,4-benzoquinol methylase